MQLKNLLKIFADNDCNKVYIKKLSANDNSKNQVYFGGSFDVLNIFPIQEITSDSDDKGGSKKTRFKTKLHFYWTNINGEIHKAPDAQLILYPKYPEVRFSGFLKGCDVAPSEIMVQRITNRILFLGVSKSNKVIGYVDFPESELYYEFENLKVDEIAGVFNVITLDGNRVEKNSKGKLLSELKRINNLGWIDSKGFDRDGKIMPCVSTNCGGVTLETELGIFANSRSEPDFLGWEIKQFGVSDFHKIGSKPITLMTPEPTGGFYVEKGIEAFIRTYGYSDKLGREARINFGGIHIFGAKHKSTNLTMVLEGYDSVEDKIYNSDGYLGLIDLNNNVVASWSFTSLLKHWSIKHANACYVPSLKRRVINKEYPLQYCYSNLIMLGTNTDFSIFLKQVAYGNVFYDPGIKLELAIENVRKQYIKRRSQFRIKANCITKLYRENEFVDLHKI